MYSVYYILFLFIKYCAIIFIVSVHLGGLRYWVDVKPENVYCLGPISFTFLGISANDLDLTQLIWKLHFW